MSLVTLEADLAAERLGVPQKKQVMLRVSKYSGLQNPIQ
jgi:hypothetical protein